MISKAEYKRRRQRLVEAMGEDAIAVIPTAGEQRRNRDNDYPFRPHSDFLYLTGFDEPGAVAVLFKQGRRVRFVLFCRERHPEQETWTGRRAGTEGARQHYGADESHPLEQLDQHLPGLLQGRTRLYYPLADDATFDQRVMDWLRQAQRQSRAGIQAPREIIATDTVLHEMRLIKSAAEIKLMRRAAQISAAAHCRAMRACRPGLHEYALEAELLYYFRRHGCETAYPSIVGGGDNACILHYTRNDSPLADGDLVLIDAGAEYQHYAADITRTFPVNGRFSPPQRALYQLVLKAQRAAIGQIKPGRHWNQAHQAAVRVLTHGLVELGLLKGKPRELIRAEAYRRFYMHRTGHWLGMDVHDVGDYRRDGRWRELVPGMVLTVEPGLYIPRGSKGVAKQWQGMGIRIEDDVLVTRQGCEVLTAAVPKEIDHIEALMAK